MKRGLTVAAAAAAILAASLSGCSSNNKPASSGSSSAAPGGGGNASSKVLIEGQDQHVSGTTVCTTVGGTVNIAIGGQATGIGAVLSDGSPPEVKSVALGNVNGVTLAYAPGTPDAKAEATKNGSSYKISGTATGADMANPTAIVKKSFEIDVSCP
ncbi:lipoprotein LpqH [Mycobacterium vicinigordonae]|uniref:Lipoprotein LpqH n=1 Tax=Mycobacterium vicinigordonae TaxID=1719132 RepID=A0A7D6I0P7_9MYCO|nr:lipoprotein LpqH [Mycobacterium vicinigordonae]QLL07294.1 lipoprotein LpqH [Mycobacterium vicinigordonae]